MKTILGIFLLTTFFGTAALAQSTDTPSGPVIFSAPKKEEIKEFVSEKDKFKADFPGVPRETVISGDVNSYIVRRSGSSASVIVQGSPQNLDKKENRGQLLAAIMAANAQDPEMKISDEKDVNLGKHKGKQFATTYGPNGMNHSIVRFVFAGYRMYQLISDVTNWHILSDDKKKEFEAETQRFFDSFKLIENK